jgi:hypothetical protein
MADVVMPQSTPCIFNKAWYGKCGKPSDNGWCTLHENAKCIVCGEHAVRTCEYTGSSSFVCGVKLCAECGHEPYIEGEVPYPSQHFNKTELAAAMERATKK